VIRPHPLAYLLGLEGLALLRAYAGDHDAAFVEARIAEVRALLDLTWDEGPGLPAIGSAEAYDSWAGSYDDGENALVAIEEPIVRDILAGLPAGVALDAACGTGRHSAYLAELGHTVIGVDSSPRMLERAREKVPAGSFLSGDLQALPLPDDHVDLVVCALALMHVRDLRAVLGELTRVLRPGGSLVVSDWRGLHGIPLPFVKAGGYVPSWNRPTSEYLSIALALGLELRRCEEPLRPSPVVDPDAAPVDDPDGIWDLMTWAPAAANAAYEGAPIALVLHFELAR